MSTARSHGVVAMLAAAGLALAGCGGSAQGADTPPPEVANVSVAAEGEPGVITLAEVAEKRLVLQTVEVAAGPAGNVVPYSAVVYQPDGSSWVFVQTAPHTYQRSAISITNIGADQVTVSSGPEVGTPVVSQGAAELVGVETGIDGEE
jgi:Tfp pilus assembly protein FimT